MIKQHKPNFGTWERNINIGPYEDWDRKTDTFTFLVSNSWWQRVAKPYRHTIDLEIDCINAGRPIIDGTDIVEWLQDSIRGCAFVAAFDHSYRKHPQSNMLLVSNIALRFTDPGDRILFKLRFANLTKKDSLQDYVAA